MTMTLAKELYTLIFLLKLISAISYLTKYSLSNNCKLNFNCFYCVSKTEVIENNDPYHNYNLFERVLFHRFSQSVSKEIGLSDREIPKSFNSLINNIQLMTYENPSDIVQIKSVNILVNLFPSWLLPAFIIMFSKPFPKFSAWMNCWVTSWTTTWLMGPSKVYDIETSITKSDILKEQGLLIEKCLFLEKSNCLRTCYHACKLPTETFFKDKMGINVSIQPNASDYSCKFEFGVDSPNYKNDKIVNNNDPCLLECPNKINKLSNEGTNSCILR